MRRTGVVPWAWIAAMADDSDDHSLARDMIEVHGLNAATVARDNARGAALAGQRRAGEGVDQGAGDHPAAAGRPSTADLRRLQRRSRSEEESGERKISAS